MTFRHCRLRPFVHIAAGDQEAQAGTSVDVNGFGIAPVRLGNDAHAVAVAFQNPGNDGMAEGVVVNVSIADDVDEIALLPTPVDHILLADRQKRHGNTSERTYFLHYSRFGANREV